MTYFNSSNISTWKALNTKVNDEIASLDAANPLQAAIVRTIDFALLQMNVCESCEICFAIDVSTRHEPCERSLYEMYVQYMLSFLTNFSDGFSKANTSFSLIDFNEESKVVFNAANDELNSLSFIAMRPISGNADVHKALEMSGSVLCKHNQKRKILFCIGSTATADEIKNNDYCHTLKALDIEMHMCVIDAAKKMGILFDDNNSKVFDTVSCYGFNRCSLDFALPFITTLTSIMRYPVITNRTLTRYF